MCLIWPLPTFQLYPVLAFLSILGDASGKESACQCRRRFDPWVGKIPWSRKWQPTPVFLPGKFHGQRKLAGPAHRVSKSWTKLSTHTQDKVLSYAGPYFPKIHRTWTAMFSELLYPLLVVFFSSTVIRLSTDTCCFSQGDSF